MSKTLWIIIAVLVVIGIAYYAMSGKSATNTQGLTPQPGATSPTVTQPAPTITPTPQPQTSSQSLKALIMLGSSQKCQFSDAGSTGTFYVANGKARGDFTTTADQKNVTSHMIMDGTTSYVWSDGQSQGVKMTIDAAAQNSTGTQGKSVDANKKIDYRCEAWTADSAQFAMPSGVTFIDIKAMTPKQ